MANANGVLTAVVVTQIDRDVAEYVGRWVETVDEGDSPLVDTAAIGYLCQLVLSRSNEQFEHRIECPNCFGSGVDLDGFNEPIACGLCVGSGSVLQSQLPEEWK